MKIIDVNLSVGGRDSYGEMIELDALLVQMRLYRIDHAVCWNEYAMLDPQSGNARMWELAKHADGKVGVSAVLDPILGEQSLPGSGNLTDRLKALHPESVHIFPTDNRTIFTAFYWEEILRAVNVLSLPLIVDDDYSPEFFAVLPEIADRYPDVKFILVRYGLCRGRHVMPLLQKCKNVYFTIENMLDNGQIEEIRERIGVDKLLFGTSWPKLSPSGALGLALYADISEEDREKILFRNWEAIRV